jgi:hypothetical protein
MRGATVKGLDDVKIAAEFGFAAERAGVQDAASPPYLPQTD